MGKTINQLTTSIGGSLAGATEMEGQLSGATTTGKFTLTELKAALDALGGAVAPTVVSCTCPNGAPNTLVYVFSQSMTAVTVAGHTAKKNGAAWNHVSVTGSGTTWTFTMPSAAAFGDTLLRSYNSTTGATIGTSLELVSFTDSAVTNSIAGAGGLPHTSPFTAANGTAITGYTPDAGNAWTNEFGTAEIQSNKATSLTFATTTQISLVNLGAAAYTITTIYAKPGGSGRITYLFFRYTDTNNKMYMTIENNDVKLYSVVAGVQTQVGSTVNPSPSISDAPAHTIVCTVAGSACTITIDGNAVFTGAAIPGGLSSGTTVGIGSDGVGNTAGDVTFDSFNAVA